MEGTGGRTGRDVIAGVANAMAAVMSRRFVASWEARCGSNFMAGETGFVGFEGVAMVFVGGVEGRLRLVRAKKISP
jgi:hypothetical protein